MTTPSPSKMMEAHIHLNLGIYFDKIQEISRICVVTSQIIPDFYWNFAYSKSGGSLTIGELDEAISQLSAQNKVSAIWQMADSPIPDGWSVQSEEAWMWMDSEGGALSDINDNVVFEILEHDTPSAEMKSVFEEAYSSGGSEGDVGYFLLPPEYGKAYAEGVAQSPASLRHFSGWLNGECVVVAASSVWEKIGGIYSVATSHGYRSKGLASTISSYAARWALSNGASGIMLQTSADSPVEKMYEKLGFRRSHIGALLTKNTSK